MIISIFVLQKRECCLEEVNISALFWTYVLSYYRMSRSLGDTEVCRRDCSVGHPRLAGRLTSNQIAADQGGKWRCHMWHGFRGRFSSWAENIIVLTVDSPLRTQPRGDGGRWSPRQRERKREYDILYPHFICKQCPVCFSPSVDVCALGQVDPSTVDCHITYCLGRHLAGLSVSSLWDLRVREIHITGCAMSRNWL